MRRCVNAGRNGYYKAENNFSVFLFCIRFYGSDEGIYKSRQWYMLKVMVTLWLRSAVTLQSTERKLATSQGAGDDAKVIFQ